MAEELRLLNSLELTNDSGLTEIDNLINRVPYLKQTLGDFLRKFEKLEQGSRELVQYFSCPKEQTAIVLIDFQWDFVRGSLRTDRCPAKHDAVKIVNKVNDLIQQPFGKVFVSYDWHPKNHISFYENRMSVNLSQSNRITRLEDVKVYDVLMVIDSHGNERQQKLWPSHCIADTKGSQLYPDIKLPDLVIPIYKGTIQDVESYSVFGDPFGLEDTGFLQKLKQNGIRLIVMCGIAFDVCVASSAIDAAKLGFLVVVVEDACVGISPENIAAKRTEMLEVGIWITTSEKIPALLAGETIPLQHVIKVLKDFET